MSCFKSTKIKIINWNIDKLNRDDIKKIISTYVQSFSEILKDYAKPEYDYSEELENFIKNLKEWPRLFNINYLKDGEKIRLTNTKR